MQIAQVFLTGHLGGDAETRSLPDGNNSVTTFSICINSYQGKGKPEAKKWIRVEAWNLHDTVLGGLHKGNRVTVFGQLKVNEFTKADGTTVSEFMVSCQSSGVDTERTKSNEPRTNGQAYRKSGQPVHNFSKPADYGYWEEDALF